MFVIVNIAGQQFKVKKNDELFVHRLEGNAGDKVAFSDILLVNNEGNITFANKKLIFLVLLFWILYPDLILCLSLLFLKNSYFKSF